MTVWVLDLDGVVWLAEKPIAGAADAVGLLRAGGHDVVFVTNNSSLTRSAYEEKLATHGIDARGAVVSSATVAGGLLEPGERVLVAGGPGVREAVRDRGAEIVEGPDADAVIVGFHREFDYERLRLAATAIRSGARLVATNDDATYPTPEGPIPGTGALLAAIERASGATATIAGKPYQPMVDYLRERYGSEGIVVGDRPDTDGRLAEALGYRFALVLTGVTSADEAEALDPPPAIIGADLASVAERAAG